MKIPEAIRQVNYVLSHLQVLKANHPEAVLVPTTRGGRFGLKAYQQHPRATTIEQFEASARTLIPRLEELRTTHPDADILPRSHKKHLSFIGFLGSKLTGVECDSTLNRETAEVR